MIFFYNLHISINYFFIRKTITIIIYFILLKTNNNIYNQHIIIRIKNSNNNLKNTKNIYIIKNNIEYHN
jgi:hypothetical protein